MTLHSWWRKNTCKTLEKSSCMVAIKLKDLYDLKWYILVKTQTLKKTFVVFFMQALLMG